MEIEDQLEAETEKMLEEIKEKRQKVCTVDNNNELIKNVDAYISDASYFLNKKDFIHGFEAVVWAFSWLEILEQLGIIKMEV